LVKGHHVDGSVERYDKTRVEAGQSRWVSTQKYKPHHPNVHTHETHNEMQNQNDILYKEHHKKLAKESHERIHRHDHNATPDKDNDYGGHPEPSRFVAEKAA